jgi:hypothetical protein
MKHISLLVFAAIVGPMGGACFAQPATQPATSANLTQDQMMQRMQDLQSQVTDLRSRLDAQQPTSAPATRPAQAPSAPPGSSLTAGYNIDKGFYIKTEDGSFLLHPWAFIQGRDAYNYRSIDTSNAHDGQNGFELPRAKFILDGNIFSKDLTFQMIWATSDTTGNLGLQDAWGRYHFSNSVFAIEGGQIRNPLDHEQILFATKTMTPERSIVNNVLLNGDDIVKGIMLSAGYDTPGTLRGELAITGGERNSDTSFQAYPTNPASWGIAGRAEWKLMGDWADYNQFTSLADKESLLVFGAGADYTEGGATAGLTHVVDAQYNLPNGLSLYGAYLGRYVRHDAGSPDTNGQPTSDSASYASSDTYDATARFMAGYLIDRHLEPFVRYEYLHFDPREFSIPTNYDISDITLGFNYYLYGHRAKITCGASYLPEGSPISNGLGDLLPTHRGQEFILQSQVQLIF